MKRIASSVAAAAALVLAVVGAAAPPRVAADAYVVQNAATGEVLAAFDERERVPIASITKLMTALVTLEHAQLDELVTVSKRAAAVGESSIHLRAGERLTVADLLRAALIQSANDAANALAAHVGRGSVPRFVGMMNAKARALGLTDTHFANPDGLDAPGHVSSARDVTKLARVAMRKPFIRETVRTVETSVAGRRLVNWNDLLSTFPRLLGVKTGHTGGAGWSEVAAARGPGVTIYATLLGGPTRAGRNEDLAELLAWGLARYRAVWAVDGERVYARARTAYGQPSVRLVAAKPVLRVVRIDRTLVERIVAPVEVALPMRAGQRLGEVRVLDRGKVIASSPLVAADAIERPGRVGRVGFYAKRTLHHLRGAFS
ncbi:MAG: D-alanyl-D-alanine carboxypeptidase family protein [Gaiellaceae bacterium]